MRESRENPKVSIVVPVYNCELYLEKCIDSVCGQTYKNIQIIIINDGSTDASRMILDRINDLRVTVIHKKNSGVCAARNDGIATATGEYITFIDADDYIEPDYVGKMVKAAVENSSELVISGFIFEDNTGKVINKQTPKGYEKGVDEMWAYRLSSAWGRLYDRSYWNNNKLSCTQQKGVRGEDVPVCLFANYTAKGICVIDYAGYHYVRHEGSAMHEFVGLRKHGFPYDAMNELAERIGSLKEHNSREFFDVGVLKLFAQFYFYMGRGADREIKREMYRRFEQYLTKNCPNYKDSWRYVRKRSVLPLPIMGAIELFVLRLSI